VPESSIEVCEAIDTRFMYENRKHSLQEKELHSELMDATLPHAILIAREMCIVDKSRTVPDIKQVSQGERHRRHSRCKVRH
jgi:hypothetical protein